MKCPRCGLEDQLEVIATSPVGDEWEVYQCKTCYYSFRSTEDPQISEIFKLDPAQIPNLDKIPPVPPLA